MGGNPFIATYDEDDDEEDEDQYGDMKKASVRTLELMEEIAENMDDQNRLTSRKSTSFMKPNDDRVLKTVSKLSDQVSELTKTCELQNKTIEKLIEKLK